MQIATLASGSAGNCYHVTADAAAPLLLECGIRHAEIQRGIGFQVTSLAGCLVSHGHQDHCRAVVDMLRAGVDTYMAAGTIEALGLAAHHRLHPVRALESVRVGAWTVLPFAVVHDAAALGFLVANGRHKLLYASDTCYLPYRFAGLTHVMIECNHDPEIMQAAVEAGSLAPEAARRIRRSHMSIDAVKDMLRANDLSRVEEIHLLHLSQQNSDASRFKREIMAVAGVPVYVAGGGVSSES